MTDQYTFTDPVTQYRQDGYPEQHQDPPGLAAELEPKADHGEGSYRGTGRLTGRKALVTGADSGIGRAVAIALAREGADVVLNYLPSEEKDAQEVADLVRTAGRTAVLAPADLTDECAARGIVRTTVEKFGGIDLLVNVAGKQQYVEKLEDLSPDQFDATFKTNVYALFWIIQEAVPHMPAGSTIVNTSSIQAYTPSPGLVDYATTKMAINTMSKALAQQLAPRGIRVNVVAPGPFWTPLQASGGQPTSALPEFGQETPLGRAGQPAELAGAYVYLSSAESGYVTGDTLNVNGGMPTP
ncbi:glucose 1-dehydrogenase [Rhodococcus sp. BP-349]|uniref:glucose 1-dehydrogenase n=1 Tax=unclassified Rhodococcus (in: high G+C Gram-positive bacteria) TaxID=192944 RepID=UPI001C9B36C4|nr:MULTISPECIES: glucose 1-dehydrogenase [unclassified Rhodococcus (in: high G+C Gram-positive bacteria)]MBY6539199.1 glucose 1-dehydrogenase [Rhodococcus sp. BP-363]MBY6544473.1 glucose 1-dehydrogenase [Rhodococcus sp. BP-369]MBY6563703.1 glucose 1-dehydrogenase [Rhodococcus sp. BP-370]MBY6577995.1 glucose 1-dehydrogenase [Rhodococcus sp. BP-364]MBY6587296.1 glucose 1-dehydrogenase [Rhodococcus sp. BP-358]